VQQIPPEIEKQEREDAKERSKDAKKISS